MREGRVNFLYAAKEGDDVRSCDLSLAYCAQAEDNLPFPTHLDGAVESVLSISEDGILLVNDRLKQALVEFEGMGDPACLDT